jgi:uncharacterized SAM-binding protein YcdF (DUF218 family)
LSGIQPEISSNQRSAGLGERGPVRWWEAACGFLLGTLLGFGALELMRGAIPAIGTDILVPIMGICGALIGAVGAQRLLWVISTGLVAILLIVGYTPLVPALMPSLIRSDPLRNAPAVVVLAAAFRTDGELSAATQARLLHGYEVMAQGYAPRLVITRLGDPPRSNLAAARRQMEQLGLHFPVDEVGPTQNTHDEAVAVARLARQRCWERVILVTHPWHMRRAAGLFDKVGLQVICSPCPEREYEINSLDSLNTRLKAFRDWAHEAIGLAIYRRRGWL